MNTRGRRGRRGRRGTRGRLLTWLWAPGTNTADYNDDAARFNAALAPEPPGAESPRFALWLVLDTEFTPAFSLNRILTNLGSIGEVMHFKVG